MKLEVVDFDIDKLDFRDRLGVWRSSSGCSILGRSQFSAYMEQLYSIIESADESTLIQLYEENERFQHCCNQCLCLNQIESDWVMDRGGRLLESLLFVHDGGPGLLVRLNAIADDGKKASTEEEVGSTEAVIGAALLTATSSLRDALDLLDQPNGKLLMNIISERAKAIELAEKKSKGYRPEVEKWKTNLRKKPPKKMDLGALRKAAFEDEFRENEQAE